MRQRRFDNWQGLVNGKGDITKDTSQQVVRCKRVKFVTRSSFADSQELTTTVSGWAALPSSVWTYTLQHEKSGVQNRQHLIKLLKPQTRRSNRTLHSPRLHLGTRLPLQWVVGVHAPPSAILAVKTHWLVSLLHPMDSLQGVFSGQVKWFRESGSRFGRPYLHEDTYAFRKKHHHYKRCPNSQSIVEVHAWVQPVQAIVARTNRAKSYAPRERTGSRWSRH